MNTKLIKLALNFKAGKATNEHISKLNSIYKLLVELKNDISEASKQDVESIFEDTDGNQLKCCKIEIKTKFGGCYSFIIPIDNDFYFAVCELLNINVSKFEAKANVIEFYADAEILEAIKKAKNFVSKDNLRPAFTGVLLHIVNDKLKVVATDAHKLYYSKQFDIVGYSPIKELKLIVDAAILDKLKLIKIEDYLTIGYNNESIFINGVECSLIDATYPAYEQVIPSYDKAMVFNNESLQGLCKKLLPYCNKATNQLVFHLNGSIAASSQDVDFSFESESKIEYISKEFNDLDISFNGKFLLQTLQLFDKKANLKMLHDASKSEKGAIFTDGIDNCLLMPLMLNR